MREQPRPGPPRILAAALKLFAYRGYRRTSMADIAREAGVARATLYLHFSEKRSLFGALAKDLVDEALGEARASWDEAAPLEDNLTAALLAKDLRFHWLLNATPHGAELLALDAALTQAQTERLDAGFRQLLTAQARRIEANGGDLSAFGDAEGFARLLAILGAGLKHECRDEGDWRHAVKGLAKLIARATVLSKS